MKHFRENIDCHLKDFSFFDPEVAVQLRDGKVLEDPVSGMVLTHIDMPLNFSWNFHKFENYAQAKSWIERRFQLKLDLPFDRKVIQEILEASVVFLEKELGVFVLQSVKKEIFQVSKSSQAIVEFVLKSSQLGRNAFSSVLVCALLKIADVIFYTQNSPALQNLEQKTKAFGNVLVSHMNAGVSSLEELEQLFLQNKIVPVSFEGGHFVLDEFYLKTKSDERIVGKLLRKPETDASMIVRDGIRARFVVKQSDLAFVLLWLEYLGFVEKKTKVSTSSSVAHNIVYMLGKFDHTHVEIQVSDRDTFRNLEGGVFRHEVFQSIQKISILMRLFSSVSDQRFQKEFDLLFQNSSHGETRSFCRSDLEQHFRKYFFKDPQCGRWYSYDYEFRVHHRGIFSPDRFRRVFLSFLHDFVLFPRWKLLEIVSFSDLVFIFDQKRFPESFFVEQKELFLQFLSEKKGIPPVFFQFLKASFKVSKKVQSLLN